MRFDVIWASEVDVDTVETAVTAEDALRAAAAWAYSRRDHEQPTPYELISQWATSIKTYDPRQLEAEGHHVFDSGLGEQIVIQRLSEEQ